jgi:hypothetical protein
MPTNTWKSRERWAAALFGGLRNIGSGSQGRIDKSASDSTVERVFIEQKHRKRHTVRTLFDATKALARKEGKVPVLVLTDHGRPGGLVCFHSDDFDEVLLERIAWLVSENHQGEDLLARLREVIACPPTPPTSRRSSPASTPASSSGD